LAHEPSHERHCETCVIGGGPAGLTVADALAQRGHPVVLLESAAQWPDDAANALNIADASGDQLPPLHQMRARALGGTTAIWSTLRRGVVGGKYVPLDPIDFETREVTPWSGWPIGRTELDPWYEAAHRVAGLSPYTASGAVAHHGLQLLPFLGDGLATSDYHWGSAERFTRDLPSALETSRHATVVRGATAIALRADGDPAQVDWIQPGGTRGTVHARRIVLAGGAIENARLLLQMYRDTHREPPWWLGRGFMEHPIDRSFILETQHRALSPGPGFYAFQGTGARANLVGRIGLSDQLLRREGLRNASIRLFPLRHRFVVRQWRRFAHSIGRTPRSRYHVLLDLEQAPHPDNRVTLSDQRDALGQPRAHLHWQWREGDEAFRVRLLDVLRREFARSGAGELLPTGGPPLEYGVHHHAGTTRMHVDPEHGVVDAHLRLHGHHNLFVVGGSVFPTSGVANPTLTILALALRLADQLVGG
jgi:choline dehydrogenase-like flavoprotein